MLRHWLFNYVNGKVMCLIVVASEFPIGTACDRKLLGMCKLNVKCLGINQRKRDLQHILVELMTCRKPNWGNILTHKQRQQTEATIRLANRATKNEAKKKRNVAPKKTRLINNFSATHKLIRCFFFVPTNVWAELSCSLSLSLSALGRSCGHFRWN